MGSLEPLAQLGKRAHTQLGAQIVQGQGRGHGLWAHKSAHGHSPRVDSSDLLLTDLPEQEVPGQEPRG